jgi:hypothetical protein
MLLKEWIILIIKELKSLISSNFVNFIFNKLYFVRSYILTTNHKQIGSMYLCFGFLTGLVGTYFSFLIRLQLAAPNTNYLEGIINFIMLL